MTPGESAAMAREIAPELVTAGIEREITVDRSNDCVVVDEAVFVKWLTPSVQQPHRGLDLVRHLDVIGFSAMPRLLGTRIVDGQVQAIAFEHIANSDDGWTWLFDRVNATIDGEPGGGESVVGDAGQLGVIAAELHLALATPSDLFPEPVGTVDRSTERVRAKSLLAAALDEVGADQHPEAHRVLHACRPVLQELVDSIPDGPTPAIMIHGDLHMGQVLRADDRIVVIDFDGNPLLNAGRPVRQPPAVDVASLVQSIDHVVRMAQHRRAGWDTDAEALATGMSLAVLGGYRMRLRAGGGEHLLDETLLPVLRAVQELHELVYAVRRLPRWIYAPTLALQGMFPDG